VSETKLTPPLYDGTAQGMFDTVARHLFEQGGPALDGGGSCVYRGYDNRRCAIGCLIPDDRYEGSMEGLTAWCGSIKEAAGIPDELEGLGVALQRAHDDADSRLDRTTYDRDKLRRHLAVIAEGRGLDRTVLDEVANAEAVS
jgi:hypothetical protein